MSQFKILKNSLIDPPYCTVYMKIYPYLFGKIQYFVSPPTPHPPFSDMPERGESEGSVHNEGGGGNQTDPPPVTHYKHKGGMILFG